VTKSERLDGLVLKLAPKAVAEQKATGLWPVKPGKESDLAGHKEKVVKGTLAGVDKDKAEDHLREFEAPHRAAPYLIDEPSPGKTRVRIYGDDGDVTSGSGATFEDALTALEAKVQ
jgi:hypothetical protein